MTSANPSSTDPRFGSRYGAAERWSGSLVVGAVAMAGVAAVVVAHDPNSFGWGVVRLCWLAVLFLAGGAIVGSERLVASSAVPLLTALLLANGEQGEGAWAESLVVGCAWFVAVEAALASIESRGGLAPSASLVAQRVVEVATVIALATAVGLLGLTVQSFAPERSLLVRAVVATGVLAALFATSRRLVAGNRTSTDP